MKKKEQSEHHAPTFSISNKLISFSFRQDLLQSVPIQLLRLREDESNPIKTKPLQFAILLYRER
jgi:hypothetical protein